MIIFVSQCLRLDKTSNADPLQLLDKISRDGISQDVCINDLGMHPCRSLERPIFSFSFIFFHSIRFCIYLLHQLNCTTVTRFHSFLLWLLDGYVVLEYQNFFLRNIVALSLRIKAPTKSVCLEFTA